MARRVRLTEYRSWPLAWMNIVLTTALCLTLCFLGIAAGRPVLTLQG